MTAEALRASAADVSGQLSTRVTAAIHQWQAELLDLSKANRLLFFKSGRGALRLSHPTTVTLYDLLANRNKGLTFYRPELADDGAEAQLELLLDRDDQDAETKAEPLRRARANEIVADGEPKKTEATLYRLRLRSRTALLEQGINVLYVAFGMLDWADTVHSEARIQSPLILLPVRLDRETALHPYTLTALDEGITLNPALAFKLERDFDLKLSLPEEGDEDTSLRAAFDHVRALIAARKDWLIHEDAYLSLFSFAKHAMYADLAANQQRFGQHSIVRALAGEAPDLDEPTMELPSTDQLDDVDPAQIFQVVDADASQQEAIAAVKSGSSLVIQGPPGTGKSQTITNVIAESLAQGKTVLFVSEKMAALRVVAKRLQKAGLREFCLEAHSQDVNKATIIHDLANTLQVGQVPKGFDRQHDLATLALTRRELNAYARALHDNDNSLQLSAFQVHGRIAQLHHAPPLTFELPNVADLTQQRIAELLASIKELDQVADVVLALEVHPWRGCLLDESSPYIQAQLNERLRRFTITADSLARRQVEIRTALSLPQQNSVEGARWMARLLSILEQRWDIPREWLLDPALAAHTRTADKFRRETTELTSRQATLFERYRPEVLQLPLMELATTLQAASGPAARRLRGDDAPGNRALRLRSEIADAVANLHVAIRRLRVAARDVARELGLPEVESVSAARRLTKIATLVLEDPRPVRSWFQQDCRSRIESLASTAGQHHELISSEHAQLLATFEADVLDVIDEAFADRFEQNYASWTRNLRPAYRKDVARLRTKLKEAHKLGYEEALEVCKRVRRIRKSQAWLSEQSDTLSAGIGVHYSGALTDWKAVQSGIATVAAISASFGNRQPPASFLDLICDTDLATNINAAYVALSEALIEFDATIAGLDRLLPVASVRVGTSTLEDAALEDLSRSFDVWLEELKPLWRAADEFASVSIEPTPRPVEELIRDAHEADWVRGTLDSLKAAEEHLQRDFGNLFAGLTTSWDDVLAALSWTESLLEHFAGSPPAQFVDALLSGVALAAETQDEFASALAEIEQLLTQVVPIFSAEEQRQDGFPSVDGELSKLADWASEKRAALPFLEEWVDCKRALGRAVAAGLGPFADSLRRDRPRKAVWRDAFLRQVYTLWLTWRYATEPALGAFRRPRHEERLAEFQQLDRWQFEVASTRVAERLVLKRPSVPAHLPRGSEVAILLRAASAKRRFRPLRKLFAEIPNLLPALKPCMLMSPLSVAQFLGESAVQFDVVVFDEASQILPADAIGAIGRGKQVVVVGDQQQLPPTRFFDVSGQIGEDESEEELPESVLDACLAVGLPRKPLLWHYRSRHEHLIAFSNRHFYQRRLITFPSPDQTRAVQFVRVEDGIYDRGSSKVNKAEARHIADLVVEHVQSRPGESLGVITFSEAQMVAIQTELDARRRAAPELEVLLQEERSDGEGFFVKNLENVQGDERDVIFFSVGYGPDQAGNLSVNFGPLNREGGERRLNVAVTRARDRVKILASFYPHELDTSRTRARGVHLLRKYLEFADQGPIALLGEITAAGGEYESDFEEAVADALREQGLEVVPQVGVGGFRIDLGIKDPNADCYLLGVECDGATYHSSKIARDRDRLRQEVLEHLGWRIHRVWSTDWLKDPSREAARIVEAYECARNQPIPLRHPSDSSAEKAEAPRTSNHGVLKLEPPRTESSAVPGAATTSISPPARTSETAQVYERVQLGRQGYQEDFRSASRWVIAALVKTCVDVEGPVHQDRVMQAVAASYGIGRVGHLVRAQIHVGISQAVAALEVERRGHFLWTANMETPPIRSVALDGSIRPIHEVAPEEIGEAVLSILRSAFSIGRNELVTEAARLLGYDRTGARVGRAIDLAISDLIDREVVLDVGGQIRIGD